jgi:hypothetical protein
VSKLGEHLDCDAYRCIEYNPLKSLIDTEKDFVKSLKVIKACASVFSGLHLSYEPDTLTLPKFYGLPKIHKEGTPLRPITSTVGAPGYYLAKFFDVVINRVFNRSDFHITNTLEFVETIRKIKINKNDILVSFDVVSMFTSIPFSLVKRIILSKADMFKCLFGIDRFFLDRLLSYLLQDCMIFTALNSIYRQLDGLPMGSCLSPTIARLVMDEVIAFLLARIPSISYIKVFVDDSIALIDAGLANEALQVLNSFLPGKLRFTIEMEDSKFSINFLNLTLTRGKDYIITNWYKKYFASGRILNYYSSHKRTTVIGTATHFIKTVLTLSDEAFFHQNRTVIEEILRENSFPETMIISLMNKNYTLMRPPFDTKKDDVEKDDIEKDYIIFPHSICRGRDIKNVVYGLRNPNVVLADSVKNTRITSVISRKTITPVELKSNLIVIAKCVCGDKYIVDRTRFNETGVMARDRIITKNKTMCDHFGHAYQEVLFKRGLAYSSQTEFLLKYTQWKFYDRLDYFLCRVDAPNRHLRSFINNK